MNAKRLTATATAALAALTLSACGSPEPTYEGPTFDTVTEAWQHLTSSGFTCTIPLDDREPSYDVTGAEGLHCWYGEEGINLDVYFSEEQQEEALPYSQEVNPGSTYVVGPLWSISTQRPDTAQEVADAMGVPQDQVITP